MTVRLASFKNSGSDAAMSHLFWRMNILGLESFSETLWKKFFSWNEEISSNYPTTYIHIHPKSLSAAIKRSGSCLFIHSIYMPIITLHLSPNNIIKMYLNTVTKKFKLTVFIKVDSEFATNTKTSASRQCLSIQSSRLTETSIPGESTRTTSSLRRGQRLFGQWMRTSVESPRSLLLQRAWASWPMPLIFCFSVDPSVVKYGSLPSTPST